MSVHRAETGREMANHESQEGGLPSIDMRSMAKMFCAGSQEVWEVTQG